MRKRLLIVLGGVACLAAPMMLFAPANAAPDGAASDGATNTVEHYVNKTQAQKIAEYWTPERMANATPVDLPQPSQQHGSTKKRTREQPQTLAEPVAPTGPTTKLYRSHVVGKVFFINSAGTKKVCSGSAINNPAKNMVFTAGHCVHEGDGGSWHSKWIFVPSYWNGERPFGKFVPYKRVTVDRWAENGDEGYDSALALVMTNSNGTELVDAVGGNGLSVGGSKEQFHTIIGYPVEDKENTGIQYWCEDTSSASWYNREISTDCGDILTSGASGGPWMLDYEDRQDGSGRGTVHGVTSNGDVFPPTDNLRSPYFTNDVEGDMYRQNSNG